MRLAVSALNMQSKSGYLKAGISRYAYQLIDRLVSSQMEQLTVFVSTDFETPAKWLKQCDVIPINLHKWRKKALWEMVGSLPYIKKIEPDIWFSTAHAIPLASLCRRAVMIHDLFPMRYPELFKGGYASNVSRAMRFSIKHADMLMANSQATKDDIIAVFGTPASRIQVTPLGPGNVLPPRKRETIPLDDIRKLGIPFDRYLLTMSTIGPRKNIPALVRAFAKIVKEKDQHDLGLVIAGAAEWGASEVNETVLKEGIVPQVVFPGYIPDADIPTLFGRADAFVFPSLHEGFGMPLLEAMLQEIPCCATGRGALREVGGDAVAYFDPEDPNDIAETVLSVLRSSDTQKEMIERGRVQSSQFTWDRTAAATLAAFDAAL